MTLSQWKSVVKSAIIQDASMQLTTQCANNRKTSHRKYESSYLKKLDPNIARVIFKARTRIFDIKVNYEGKYKFNLDCPFCKYYDETFDHIFKCNSGLFRSRCV